jgi:hypothetical protein
MSGNPPTIEWYIAREGAQHGPISDVELRKFLELGHLRPTDLVWCASFTDWKTGQQAFPDSFQPKPAPPAPVAPSAPPAAPATSPAAAAAPAIQAAAAAAGTVDAAGRSAPGQAAPRYMDALGSSRRDPAELSDTRAAVPGDAQLETTPQGSFTPSRHKDEEEQFEEPAPRSRRGWIGMATAAFAVLLIAGGLGWFAWQNRSLVSDASAIGNVLTTAVTGNQSAEYFRAAPYIATGESKAQIDASLQNIAVWRFLKREFGDWYQEIVAEVEKMRIQKQDERVITQYFVNVIVTLRRRNALAALQSSPEHLRGMATAFVTNLKQLGSRDGATCYAFITHGEASPFMIELSKTPAFAETLQKQMIAVFSGVVDARASRKIHANTRRPDYDALTEYLTKQKGWSQQDLATFSDPQKLSTTLPDKVCTLVQDWFSTQLSIKDTEQQSRLLAESLKPLVGG